MSDASSFMTLANRLAGVVTEKNRQYGDSAERAGAILSTLFPTGIKPVQFADVLLMVRVVDKLCRIAVAENGKDAGNESPWMDIAGYALIGWQGWERRTA